MEVEVLVQNCSRLYSINNTNKLRLLVSKAYMGEKKLQEDKLAYSVNLEENITALN